MPITDGRLKLAYELADPHFSLSIPDEAKTIISDLLEDRAQHRAVVTTLDELQSLPVGSLILARVDSTNAHQVLRVPDGGASTGNASLLGGKHWDDVLTWAARIEVLYRAPEVTP